MVTSCMPVSGGFLSTLSLRRATNVRPDTRRPCAISIHALLAESDLDVTIIGRTWDISIHALLAESDITDIDFRIIAKISIHALLAESDGGCKWGPGIPDFISIHALLAESDTCQSLLCRAPSYFYPRSPCGERHPMGGHEEPFRSYFYPRSPCGERQSKLWRT